LPFFYKTRELTNQLSQKEEPKLAERNYEGLVLQRVPRCDILKTGLREKEIISETEIFSTPDRLWQIILNSQNIYSKKLATSRGNSKGTISIVGKRGRISKGILTQLNQNSSIGWKGKEFFIPGLLQRQTLFHIIPHVDGIGVTLLHRETFSGLLVPFMNSRILRVRSEIQLSSTEIREKAEDIR